LELLKTTLYYITCFSLLIFNTPYRKPDRLIVIITQYIIKDVVHTAVIGSRWQALGCTPPLIVAAYVSECSIFYPYKMALCQNSL